MSGRATPRRALSLTPAHLVRVGTGLDAVRIQARGPGILIGTFGVRRVRAVLDVVVLHRFRTARCRALLIGLRGVSWVSIPLAPVSPLAAPQVTPLFAPSSPPPPTLPSLAFTLTVTPPEPP